MLHELDTVEPWDFGVGLQERETCLVLGCSVGVTVGARSGQALGAQATSPPSTRSMTDAEVLARTIRSPMTDRKSVGLTKDGNRTGADTLGLGLRVASVSEPRFTPREIQ